MPTLSVVSALKNIAAIASLNDLQLASIADLGNYATMRPGQTLFRAGEEWPAMYIILSGEIRLVDNGERNGRDDGEGLNSRTIDVLSGGSCLGESILFSAQSTTDFSAITISDVALLTIPSDLLHKLLQCSPDISELLRQQAERQAARTFLAGSTAFAVLTPVQLDFLVASLKPREIEAGQVLIREGEIATELYIIAAGRFRVYRTHTPQNILAILGQGSIVGEAALIEDTRRNANVVAEIPGRVFAVPKSVFLELLTRQKVFSTSINELLKERSPASTAPAILTESSAQRDAGDEVVWQEAALSVPLGLRRRFSRPAAIRQQSQMDCGAACLATICLHYGKRVSLNRLRDMARVNASGASMLNLWAAANELGFETIPMLSTWEQLGQTHLPALVNWRGYHWIVVHRVTPENVTVADPGDGLKKIAKAEFLKGWTLYSLFLRPTSRFRDLVEEKPALHQFNDYISPWRKLLFEIGLASFCIQLIGLLQPVLTQFVIDDVVVKKDPRWLAPSLIAVGVLVAFSTAVRLVRQRLLLFISLKINVQLTTDFYHRLLSLPLPFFENRKVGDITSRFAENEKVTKFFTHTGVDLPIDVFSALTNLCLMLYYNIPLALAVMLFLSIQIVNLLYLTPMLRGVFRNAFEKQAATASHIIESLTGLRTVKVLGIEHLVRWKFEHLFAGLTNAYFKSIWVSMISSLASQLIDNAASVAVLFYGAVLVLHNRLSIGELVAFMVMSKNLNAPVLKLVGVWSQFQETLVAVERLNDVLESKPSDTLKPGAGQVVLQKVRGHVRFENVTFRYQENGKNIVQNINLEVKPGQKIAFVGRSGSGKSTLVKLLLGFYPVSGGHIYVDGFALDDVWLPSLRKQIGVVPQESYLFRATIRENIAQTKPSAPLSEVVEAAKRAGAHEFVSTMPNGYETLLEEQATNLSGGQRQRLAIARAILQNPRMLVLDEATSALDSESERFFLHTLDSTFEDRTVFTIAHRLSTVQNADLIVVIDHGNIIEQGDHKELMARQGLYYFLATQQLNL